MGLAIDTIGLLRTAGGGADTVFTAGTVAAGDSLTIRSTPQGGGIELERVMTQGILGSAYRVRSPLLHDNVEGLQFFPGTTPSQGLLSDWTSQMLDAQDTLIFEAIANGAAANVVMVLGVAYANLPGANARMYSKSDILPLIKSLKVIRVTMGGGGAAGVWLDTAVTTTENLLHANTDYAVLGYITDTALAAVGIKGADTSNFRNCGPGVTDANITKDYFVRQSEWQGQPRIPVFNAANGPSTFVSAFASVSPSAANVQLYCAELSRNIT